MEISVVKYTGPFRVSTDFVLHFVGALDGRGNLEASLYETDGAKKFYTVNGEYPRCYSLIRDLYVQTHNEMCPENSITVAIESIPVCFYPDVIRTVLLFFGNALKRVIFLTHESEEAEKFLIKLVGDEDE